MKTLTDDLPQPGDVVLLKSEPDFFAVLDYHPDTGWELIRLVRAARLGRYRTRHPGPTRPVQELAVFGMRGPVSFVRETKTVGAGEIDQFLSVEGVLEGADLQAARELAR